MAGRFVVVVPVKSPGVGKSRLAEVPDAVRSRLAAAFASDTVRACLAADSVAAVLVTTDDAEVAAAVTALGARTCADAGSGLNPALRSAAAVARSHWPDLQPVALLADLPALRADDLAGTLRAVTGAPSYVVDAAGSGTSLYTAAYDDFDPRFGLDSAAAHAASGATALVAPASVRTDVDDLTDLRAAAAIGVGPATAAVLAEDWWAAASTGS